MHTCVHVFMWAMLYLEILWNKGQRANLCIGEHCVWGERGMVSWGGGERGMVSWGGGRKGRGERCVWGERGMVSWGGGERGMVSWGGGERGVMSTVCGERGAW